MKLTLQLQLIPDADQKADLLATIRVFNEAEPMPLNKVSLPGSSGKSPSIGLPIALFGISSGCRHK